MNRPDDRESFGANSEREGGSALRPPSFPTCECCHRSTLQDLRVTPSSESVGPPPSTPACRTPAAEQHARPLQRWGPRPSLAS
eukprot:4362269-Pyramimonas_sp.AAC.1